LSLVIDNDSPPFSHFGAAFAVWLALGAI